MFPDKEFRKHRNLSIYVHIPFCSTKCGYCDYYSVGGASSEIIEASIGSIIADLDQAVSLVARGSESITSIYVGGGTPSLLAPNLLDSLLAAIECYAPDGLIEYTVEANPESITEEFLQTCLRRGVSRLSVGVQSFDPEELHYLDRGASPDDIRRALALLSEHFPGIYNLDLMVGLPHQTEASLAESIRLATSFDPNHISLYTLVVEPGTPLSRQILDGTKSEIVSEARGELWRAGIKMLESANYEWYEVSNFARGHRGIHNLAYCHLQPYLGIGPGSESTLSARTGPVRVAASRTPGRARYEASEITPSQFLLEHFMMGLRMTDGVAEERIVKVFGLDLQSVIGEATRRYVDNGYLHVSNASLAATRLGMGFLDEILTAIALDIDTVRPRFCTWPG